MFLRKRSLIETVNDKLKNISQIQHTRHRSVCNFILNVIAGLIGDKSNQDTFCRHASSENITQIRFDKKRRIKRPKNVD